MQRKAELRFNVAAYNTASNKTAFVWDEITPEGLYADTYSCNLGYPSITETVRLREIMHPDVR